MSDEWGPWIKHDGSGCPVDGHQIVHTVDRLGEEHFSRADDPINVCAVGSSWEWDMSDPCSADIIRYRLRKPRALLQLREVLEGVPDPAKQREHT